MRTLYRRIRYGEPIVVVSGLPRSGTSMAMQMLAAGGHPVVTDGIREADQDNPKGYYEEERVKDLHLNGVDRCWVRGTRGKAIKIISFLLKYLPKDNNYKIIFMRRDLGEVLASQTKMLERRGEPNETSDEEMLSIWQNHLWRVNYLLKHAPHMEAIEIVYSDAIGDPMREVTRIRDFLGRELKLDRMAGIVDPSLHRN
ncbi:MAG TPA: sulfotransferase [Gammaproteobacteria bacterium]|nr:sulfotransferase [Gammaproteobacteria bacterium]